MKNEILFCLTFLFLCIYSYGSPIYFYKKCKNKGFFYTYEICSECNSDAVTPADAGFVYNPVKVYL